MNGVLIPRRIFVGDSAQFLFLLSEKEYRSLTAHGFTAGIPLPLQNITQNDMMSVQEIRIVEREAEHYLAITFVPWQTGEIDFPTLPFLPLSNKIPAISVSSLLDNNHPISLQPPKPPMLPPGTDFLLYGAAVVSISLFALLSTGAWLLVRKLRKKTRRTVKKRHAALREQLKRLYKEARKIQKRLSTGDAGTSQNSAGAAAIVIWYASIDRSLREYIHALYTDNTFETPSKGEAYFLSATYTELTQTLMEIFDSRQEIADLFCIFYAGLERQRFGSSPSDLIRNYTAVSQDMLKRIPHIAERTEVEYTLLRQNKYQH